MPLPASLPPWLQTVNTGQFGRGIQLGEEMRANRAAEQFKQQELMRQRQQDAIAQQQHEQQRLHDQQREAIQDQQWKADFGLRQQENKARIDQQAQAVKTAASKLAAQQQLQKALAEWQAKPERDMNEYYNIIARYGPAAGVNIGSMLSQQAKPAPTPKLAPAPKATGPKPLTEEQRDRAVERRQASLDKFQQEMDNFGDASTDNAAKAARRKTLQTNIDRLQGEIEALESGQELYGQANQATPNQEAAGAYVPPKIGRGGAIPSATAPTNVRRYDVNGNPVTAAPAQAAATPPAAGQTGVQGFLNRLGLGGSANAPAAPKVAPSPSPNLHIPAQPTVPNYQQGMYDQEAKNRDKQQQATIINGLDDTKTAALFAKTAKSPIHQDSMQRWVDDNEKEWTVPEMKKSILDSINAQ